ncbi:MAG TPA: hypothetical protein VK874_17070 [Gaiellaceae bacterium]|nr:hypothetical protein [Gaiellaceae bacterium]
MSRLSATARRLAAEREVRLASFAAAPLLWFAIAWTDVRALLLVPVAVFAATHALRGIARRRRSEDDFIL